MKKERKMNQISLVKTTILVAVSVSASFLISAEPVKSKLNTTINNVKEEISFAKVISKFDKNKDGQLNQLEVTNSTNVLLKKAFNAIDLNNDFSINEAEFNTYLAKIKK